MRCYRDKKKEFKERASAGATVGRTLKLSLPLTSHKGCPRAMAFTSCGSHTQGAQWQSPEGAPPCLHLSRSHPYLPLSSPLQPEVPVLDRPFNGDTQGCLPQPRWAGDKRGSEVLCCRSWRQVERKTWPCSNESQSP
jgi:hypothetical protein